MLGYTPAAVMAQLPPRRWHATRSRQVPLLKTGYLTRKGKLGSSHGPTSSLLSEGVSSRWMEQSGVLSSGRAGTRTPTLIGALGSTRATASASTAEGTSPAAINSGVFFPNRVWIPANHMGVKTQVHEPVRP